MFGSDRATKIQADLIRRHLKQRNPYLAMTKALSKISDERLIEMEKMHTAFKLKQMSKRNAQAGFASLIAALVVSALLITLFAVAAQNLVRVSQVTNELAAGQWAATINAAEFSYMATQGAAVQPSALSGVLGSLPNCANPMLVSGQVANGQPAPGYGYSFVGTGNAASFACIGGPTAGYLGYAISIDPTNPMLAGSRHFYTCTGASPGCNGQIHFNDAAPASVSDPVWNTSMSGSSGGSGSGNQTTAPTPILLGSWSSTATYAKGQEVLFPTSTNSTGLFANLTASNSATGQNPLGDATNWIQIGSYSVAPPSLTGSFSGVQLLGGSDYTCPVSGLNCAVVKTQGAVPNDYTTLSTSFTFSTFTVTMSPANGGSPLTIYTQPFPNPGGPANIACTIPAGGTTCTTNISPVVLPSGSQMEIIVVPSLSYQSESLVWTMN